MSETKVGPRCRQCQKHPSTSGFRWLHHPDDGLKHRVLYWHGGTWSLCGEREFADEVQPAEEEAE